LQDQYGEDDAFPTHKVVHALVKVIREEGSFLPMLEVMRDRSRRRYFGLQTPWERWLAYTQSTSFCRYLIERYGSEKFFGLYNVPFEAIDFRGLYGKTAEVLVDDWIRFVTDLPTESALARTIFQNTRGFRSRK